jgi:hypothetical protein
MDVRAADAARRGRHDRDGDVGEFRADVRVEAKSDVCCDELRK